ncbi:hypothetical protein [Sorangium sp. So ce388]|uniref:hypothetical protein n=1 Tax=Sorangium sp. So ce388 TaxID=3133309 RepID=UPI003F5C490F
MSASAPQGKAMANTGTMRIISRCSSVADISGVEPSFHPDIDGLWGAPRRRDPDRRLRPLAGSSNPHGGEAGRARPSLGHRAKIPVHFTISARAPGSVRAPETDDTEPGQHQGGHVISGAAPGHSALGLGYHERHHRTPGLPCSRLALPIPDRRAHGGREGAPSGQPFFDERRSEGDRVRVVDREHSHGGVSDRGKIHATPRLARGCSHESVVAPSP